MGYDSPGLHSVDDPLVSKTIVRFKFFILVKKEGPNKRHRKCFLKYWLQEKYHHVWCELLKLSQNHFIFQQLLTFIDEWTNCLIACEMLHYETYDTTEAGHKLVLFQRPCGLSGLFFKRTRDIFYFLYIYFSWICYLKRIKANLEKYVRYLYLKFLNDLFVSKCFYDSVDFVQLDG